MTTVVIVATLGVSYDRITVTTYYGREAMHPPCIVDQVGQHSIAILINVRRIMTAQ